MKLQLNLQTLYVTFVVIVFVIVNMLSSSPDVFAAPQNTISSAGLVMRTNNKLF